MVELSDVGVTYDGGTVALRDVTLTFRPGEFAVPLGVSGAGKSTLLRCLNGLVRRVLARGLHSVGMVAKFFAEAIERSWDPPTTWWPSSTGACPKGP